MQLLKRPPARSPRWWAFDVLVVLVGLSVSTHWDPDIPAHHGWFGISGPLLEALPLLVRRIWPQRVFWWVFVATCAYGLVDIGLASGLAVFIALYTVAASGCRRRDALLCAAALEVAVIIAAIRIAAAQWWVTSIPLTGLVIAALSMGLYRSTRRAYLTELIDRAARLEREQAQANELAVINERARISREMHDIVAHHLTVIVALSDAASLTATKDPARSVEVMQTVAAIGRQALDDTRQLLGVGRTLDTDSHQDRNPVPDLTKLNALIEGVRAAGLPVRYQIHGSPAPLPTPLQLTIYRIVQESLTNTLKHGGAGTTATVRLDYLPTMLHLHIQDDGAGSSAPCPKTPGRGLAGMRARAGASGGTLESGPKWPAGWQVAAQFKLTRTLP